MVRLEKEWKKSHVLSMKEICKLLADFAERYFEEYVKYVGNQNFQVKLFSKLLA